MNKKTLLILCALLLFVIVGASALYSSLGSQVQVGGLATQPPATTEQSFPKEETAPIVETTMPAETVDYSAPDFTGKVNVYNAALWGSTSYPYNARVLLDGEGEVNLISAHFDNEKPFVINAGILGLYGCVATRGGMKFEGTENIKSLKVVGCDVITDIYFATNIPKSVITFIELK